MNRYDEKMKELNTWYERPDLEAEFRKPPATVLESDLHILEVELGNSLPADYREFLFGYSGLIFHSTPQFSLEEIEEVEVGRFYGVGSDLIQQYRDACDSEWPIEVHSGATLIRPLADLEIVPSQDNLTWVMWPTELLPIAYSGSDALICLVIKGDKKGSIYYWIHLPSSEGPNVYFVASSFDEFMQMLHL